MLCEFLLLGSSALPSAVSLGGPARGVSEGGCAVLLPLWGSKCRFKNLLNRSKSRSESGLICPSLNFTLQALSSGVQFIEP